MVQENIEICIQCQEGGCRSVREWSSFQKEIPDNRHSTSLIPVSPGRVLLQYSTAFLMFFTDMALSPSRLGILRFRTRISKYPRALRNLTQNPGSGTIATPPPIYFFSGTKLRSSPQAINKAVPEVTIDCLNF